ncbi:MAG: hypothetical protein H6Q10_2718 [Acidobacteria bacterium]|nr:hypothetical protein [Acidobacteriota bacterium]
MTAASPLDAAVDRLYELPLDEFVAARDQLARELRGEDARTLRALAKPNVVAWALNQLYWSARPVYGQLVEATARLREAQASGLLGKPSDLRGASAAHREALSAALKESVAILGRAGHEASPDTARSLTAAFEAVPWENVGRLARPPEPLGFAAFAGMPLVARREEGGGREADGGARAATKTGASGGRRAEGLAGQTKSPQARPARAAAERAREREAEARRQQAREAVEAARRDASVAGERLRDAEGGLERAREAERDARQRLEDALRRVKEAEEAFRTAQRAATSAEAALGKAESAAARYGQRQDAAGR